MNENNIAAFQPKSGAERSDQDDAFRKFQHARFKTMDDHSQLRNTQLKNGPVFGSNCKPCFYCSLDNRHVMRGTYHIVSIHPLQTIHGGMSLPADLGLDVEVFETNALAGCNVPLRTDHDD